MQLLVLDLLVPLITKIPSEDVVVGGIHVPANFPIFISIYDIHRKPEYWENPLKYDPMRWKSIEETTDESDSNLKKDIPYLPFGFGPRQCVGMRMANLEATVVLSHILHRYNVSRVENDIDVPKFETTITLHPIGLKLRFERRNNKI